jgi:hypothetical protein
MGPQFAAKLLAWLLIPLLAVTSSAQPTPPLSKRAAAVQRSVASLVPNAPISVIPVQGQQEFGSFLSRDKDSFTFYDIDRKLNITYRYVEVRKVSNGYGGYYHLHHRHTDRTSTLIVVLAVVGALGGLIAAAAMAKN